MKVTVGDLIAALELFDHDTQIIMSHDEEGNGFSEYIEAAQDSGVVILWPSRFVEIDEVEDYVDEEEQDTDS